MAEVARYLSLPFANKPVIKNGVHVGFTVGVTLLHGDHTVTEEIDAICGAEQAAFLTSGPIEVYAAWSEQIVNEHKLKEKANSAMDLLFS